MPLAPSGVPPHDLAGAPSQCPPRPACNVGSCSLCSMTIVLLRLDRDVLDLVNPLTICFDRDVLDLISPFMAKVLSSRQLGDLPARRAMQRRIIQICTKWPGHS